MSSGAAGSAGGAAAGAAIIAEAIKASGAIVRLSPDEFQKLLHKEEKPLVVLAESGIIRTSYRYLTAHKGLIFFTKTPEPLRLKRGTEVVTAKKIWIPG